MGYLSDCDVKCLTLSSNKSFILLFDFIDLNDFIVINDFIALSDFIVLNDLH